MNRHISVILVLLLFSIESFAQKTIKVIDSQSSEPIEMVYVAILRADSTMLDYTYTESDGSCILPKLNEANYVSFSYLGYNSTVKDVESLLKEPVVKLVPGKVFKLRNVTIKSERLNTQGDTLKYSVKGFSQPQDRTIADVISKMPGLEVKDNGVILFNGRPINKFYIEGMDLLDNKYTLASNNIDYRKVRSVEVLQNHQKVAALRGKVFSENAALNIVLEDAAKSVPIGTIDLQGGYANSQNGDFLFKARLMSMLFSKKRQNLSLYKATNLGQDLYQEILPKDMGDVNSFTDIESNLVSVVSVPSAGISKERQTFNTAHLAAVNELFRLGQESFFRVQAGYFAEKSNKDVERTRIIHLSDDTKYSDYEVISKSDKTHHLDLSANYERNNTQCYLSDKLTGSAIWRKSEGSFGYGSLYSSPDQQYLQNKFKFVKPLNNVNVLTVQSDISYNNLPQRLRLFDGKEERINYHDFVTSNNVSVRRNIKGFFLTGLLGWNYKGQYIVSDISDVVNIEKQNYSQSDIFASVNGDYSVGRFRFSGDFKLHHLSVGSKSLDYNRFFADGRVSVTCKLNDVSSLVLSYNLQSSLHDVRTQFLGELWSDYKTAITYESIDEIGKVNTLNLHYSYIQPLNGTFISANINYNRGTELFATESDFDNDYYRMHYVYMPNTYYGYGTNLRVGKSFGAWKSTLSFYASYNIFHGNELMNHVLEENNGTSSLFKFQYSARPSMWLTVDFNAGLTSSSMSSDNWNYKRNKLSCDLNLSSPLTKNTILGINNNFTRLMEDNSNFFVSDAYFRYTKGRWTFNFEINNIFNTTHYVDEIVTSTIMSRTSYNIRPREFLAGCSVQL